MTLAGGGLNACVRVHLQIVTGISHPACRVTVLGGKGNYPDGVPARLGQRKVVSLLLLQSHEPACSRIGAPLILHDTIHPHHFKLPTLGGKCCTALFDYSHALSSNLMVFFLVTWGSSEDETSRAHNRSGHDSLMVVLCIATYSTLVFIC